MGCKLLIEVPVNGGRNYNGPKVGGFEAGTPVLVEPTLKYHPGSFEVLTLARDPGRGQCMVGSLTGAGHRSTDKRYSGDNRLIPPKSSYRRGSLAPRCRLITSWGCSRSQGYGCSPFKVVRELGLKRRETVWSLSAVGVGNLKGAAPSTRGPEWTNLWCTGCHASGIA
ncbi:hypothetical protein Lal_00015069, partial [Lupinus albus]